MTAEHMVVRMSPSTARLNLAFLPGVTSEGSRRIVPRERRSERSQSAEAMMKICEPVSSGINEEGTRTNDHLGAGQDCPRDPHTGEPNSTSDERARGDTEEIDECGSADGLSNGLRKRVRQEYRVGSCSLVEDVGDDGEGEDSRKGDDEVQGEDGVDEGQSSNRGGTGRAGGCRVMPLK